MSGEQSFIVRIIDTICDYIDYLMSAYGYRITIHHIENLVGEYWYRFLTYYYHRCPLCQEVKTSSQAWSHCIDRQVRVQEALKSGVLLGTCYAGVCEYVYPLCDSENNLKGFLCISGYTLDPENSLERANAACTRYGLSRKRIREAVACLECELPDRDILTSRIAPLQALFSTLFYLCSQDLRITESPSARENLYNSIIRFANGNYKSMNFSLHWLCEKIGVNYSYASHLFSEYAGMPFSRYIRRMRVETAKKYLEYTMESISFISGSCGFGDSDYFSTIFRAETGITPTRWRELYYQGSDPPSGNMLPGNESPEDPRISDKQ